MNSGEADDKSTQWHNTGDVGYCDADGYLHHVDRQSNVITMDGIRYYPEQMEHVLIAHPRVADVAVLGPRPELPAELTAVVQPLDWPTSG
jgi:fatty-acyl-CoA synthase